MAQEVDDWMATYDNPMKETVQAMREVILAADPRISECIKWPARQGSAHAESGEP